jgi:hypothetical protein
MRFPFSLGRLNSRAGRVGVPRLQAACSSPTSATQTRAVWSAQLLPLRRIRFSNSRAPGEGMTMLMMKRWSYLLLQSNL